MNIRKKLAAGAAVILPLAGLGVLGVTQTASATVPPAALTCTNLQANTSPPAGGLGGTAFDTSSTGTTPGSSGVYLGSNPGSATTHSAVTTVAIMPKGATSAEITTKVGSAVAVSGQTVSFAGATNNPYTVTSDSTPLGKAFPDYITYKPALTLPGTATSLKAGVAVTINDTSGTGMTTLMTASTYTQGTNNTTLTGNFSGITPNTPVNISYLRSGVWTDATGFHAAAANSTSGGTLTQTATTPWNYDVVVMNGSNEVANESVSATSTGAVTGTASNTITWSNNSGAYSGAFTGDNVDIYGRSLLPNNLALVGTTTWAAGTFTDTGGSLGAADPDILGDGLVITSGNSSTATLSEALTGITPDATGTDVPYNVVVSEGSTNVTPTLVYTDEDYQLFGGAGGNSNGSCFNDLGNSNGNYAPSGATIIGASTAAKANAAIGLEQNPSGWSGTITYPNVTSGWLDYNGQCAGGESWNGTADVCASEPSSVISFANPKYDLFVLLENAYTFAEGTVHGEYQIIGTAKIGFSASGMSICSIGQLEAIQSHTGPDYNNTASPYNITPADATAPQAEANYCDGGPDNNLFISNAYQVSPAAALNNLIGLELNPNANVYASDGTPLSAIWQIESNPQGNAVI